jgi:hypothetical protein
MKSYLLLLDAAPEPLTPVVGFAGLILIVLVVLMLVAAGAVGLFFLLKWLKHKNLRRSSLAVREGSS